MTEKDVTISKTFSMQLSVSKALEKLASEKKENLSKTVSDLIMKAYFEEVGKELNSIKIEQE